MSSRACQRCCSRQNFRTVACTQSKTVHLNKDEEFNYFQQIEKDSGRFGAGRLLTGLPVYWSRAFRCLAESCGGDHSLAEEPIRHRCKARFDASGRECPQACAKFVAATRHSENSRLTVLQRLPRHFLPVILQSPRTPRPNLRETARLPLVWRRLPSSAAARETAEPGPVPHHSGQNERIPQSPMTKLPRAAWLLRLRNSAHRHTGQGRLLPHRTAAQQTTRCGELIAFTATCRTSASGLPAKSSISPIRKPRLVKSRQGIAPRFTCRFVTTNQRGRLQVEPAFKPAIVAEQDLSTPHFIVGP